MKLPASIGKGAMPMSAIGEGMPKMASHGNVKPRLKARKLSVAGKSAFPAGPAAMGPPADPGDAPAFGAGPPMGAAPGDMGG